ncbi:MAG: hypothetical protein CM1200mP29_16160 [Verrucomicrobiota bacterium]|nr:MAG: hypothetical protein CM1200mP29_16160 [Verrucomicrobiota bacterium]
MSARDLLAGRADEFAKPNPARGRSVHARDPLRGRTCAGGVQVRRRRGTRDDENIFSCDAAKNGQARKIFTMREPLRLVAAITPFNHPLNQVAHKLAPAIAAGVPVLLKPSSKTPLTAIRLTELLYEAGLPSAMLSTFVGTVKRSPRRLCAIRVSIWSPLPAAPGRVNTSPQSPATRNFALSWEERAAYRAQGCRPRPGRDAGHRGVVPQLGPTLHRRQTHRRRGAGAR